MKYQELSIEQLKNIYLECEKRYKVFKDGPKKLNMARGKPAPEQLDLSASILNILKEDDDFITSDGIDCRNYGGLDGIPEARKLMGDLMGISAENVVVFGNSSLNIMYDLIGWLYTFGTGGHTPWCKLPKVKFICPSPGYDRHFAVSEEYGFELITIPMTETGPDMDMVEDICRNDDSVKGIWCVPKYSNPDGYVYSPETVERLAKLEAVAPDFKIIWDNAYIIHYLYPDKKDEIPEIFSLCRKYGTEDRVYELVSTSKMTFAGSGIAALGASDRSITEIKKRLQFRTIGYDKMNQLRHVRFFKTVDGMVEHMMRHAEIMRPKFEAVWDRLDMEIKDMGIGTYTKPTGGYFISFTTLPGCAKRVVELCKEAGMTLTPAGSAFPYKIDPEDSNIRIAPTYPSLEDIKKAAELFAVCVKMASIEKILAEK